MTVRIPQGMLSLYEAIDRLVRRKYPDKDHTDRVEGEEAWRDLCEHILQGRIHPYVLTESSKSYEADRAQFVALQERYFSFADRLRYADKEGRYRYIEGDGPLDDTLRDVHGRNVRGHLAFRESDLKTFDASEKGEGSPPKRQTRGRKPILDWEQVDNEVYRLMEDNGEFMSCDPQWKCQAQLEKAITDFVSEKFDVTPVESVIRDR
jgi:hypothetical protein